MSCGCHCWSESWMKEGRDRTNGIVIMVWLFKRWGIMASSLKCNFIRAESSSQVTHWGHCTKINLACNFADVTRWKFPSDTHGSATLAVTFLSHVPTFEPSAKSRMALFTHGQAMKDAEETSSWPCWKMWTQQTLLENRAYGQDHCWIRERELRVS